MNFSHHLNQIVCLIIIRLAFPSFFDLKWNQYDTEIEKAWYLETFKLEAFSTKNCDCNSSNKG
jgi:hypothetical protein